MWYIIYKNSKGVTTMRKELLKGLSEEQIKKIEACKNSEEILNLAKAEGIELTDEQLEVVSGGGCFYTIKCIKCGSDNLSDEYKEINHKEYRKFKCNNCGHRWREEV